MRTLISLLFVVAVAAGQAEKERLTDAPGLQANAAWSADSNLIAYTSDQTGNFDIWTRRADGAAAAKQITTDSADDWQPDWAPNSQQLVFRSERDGGGLFVANADGTGVRRLTTIGYHPRWSPDGKRILFAGAQLLLGQPQRFYVIPASGGDPRQVMSSLTEGYLTTPAACWHPDGQRITIAGIDVKRRVLVRTLAPEAETGAPGEIDWSRPANNPVYDIDGVMWSPKGDALFLVGEDGSGTHVWRMSVDPQKGERRGSPENLITREHSDLDIAPSPRATRAAFTMAHVSTRIWKYSLDPAQARISGQGHAITSEDAVAFAPDLTIDGTKLSYVSIPKPSARQPNRHELHELTEAGDRILIADTATRFAPRWSHDGRYLSYRWTPSSGAAFIATILDTTTLKERHVSSPQMWATPFGWAPDDTAIATTFQHGNPPRYGLFRLPVATDKTPAPTPLAESPKYDIWQGTYSPDGRWIAVNVHEAEARWSAICLIPSNGGPTVQITDGRGWDDKPRWSPDGRLLYFVTSRGGPFTVAAIRIDSETGKAISPAMPVLSFKAPRQKVLSDVGWMEIAVARDALALPIVETSGSIWLAPMTMKTKEPR